MIIRKGVNDQEDKLEESLRDKVRILKKKENISRNIIRKAIGIVILRGQNNLYILNFLTNKLLRNKPIINTKDIENIFLNWENKEKE